MNSSEQTDAQTLSLYVLTALTLLLKQISIVALERLAACGHGW